MATASCDKPVFPPAVIQAVNEQMQLLIQNEQEDEGNSHSESATSTTTTTRTTTTCSIPESMRLQPSLQPATLQDAVLITVETDPQVLETCVQRGSQVIKRHAGSMGSICFVVRRPAMSVLAALYPGYLEGFDMFGIIKETGVDDVGLTEFQSKYFSYPLYRDPSYAFYQALGDRRVGIMNMLFKNPWLPLVSVACETWQRIRSKEIDGTTKGEGLVQGGIIVFDALGKPLFMHPEETGEDLPVVDFVRALQAVRQTTTTTKTASAALTNSTEESN